MTAHRGTGILHTATSLLLGLCFGATALAQTLPLRHGVYVLETSKCGDAPNAAIKLWDGAGFSGAHSSECQSHIAPLANGNYRVSTTCKALGDGTPDRADASLKDTMTLTRVSSTKFMATKPAGVQMSYRWCSAK